MQNLRDKLLKAGLVDKKAKKRADHEAREQRARQGGHVVAQEAEAQRLAVWERQQAEQRARDQALEDARRAIRQERERHIRAQHLVEYYGMRLPRGQRRWYFMARNHKIHSFSVSDHDARRLERGQIAIVERIGGEDGGYTAVPDEIADQLWAVDDAYVRFFNRDFAARPPRWWEVIDLNKKSDIQAPPEPADEPS